MEHNINVAVVIPWLEKSDRKYAYDILTNWYEENLPEAMIIPSYDGKKPFCLSGSRNIGVNEAQNRGADVVIINDADTVPDITQLKQAIEYAMNNSCCVLPYDEYRSLRIEGTREFLRGLPLEFCDYFKVEGACSGCYVTTPKTWWKHYGQDERFQGWGFEDAAWLSSHKTLLGMEPHRIAGAIYAFHHEGEVKKGSQYSKNAQLCYQYLQAEGNIDEMKELASQGLFLKEMML